MLLVSCRLSISGKVLVVPFNLLLIYSKLLGRVLSWASVSVVGMWLNMARARSNGLWAALLLINVML